MSTRPNGKLFVSYRRTRQAEVDRLVRWLHLLGVPTWQDISDLSHGQTEREIPQVLSDEGISGTLLFLTPEVAESSMMRQVEIPAILDRAARDPGFAFLPVMAGGLSYEKVGEVVGPQVRQPSSWNLGPLIQSNPMSDEDSRLTAARALKLRVAALRATRGRDEAFNIQLNTWGPREAESNADLCLNWYPEFNELTKRTTASEGAWLARLLPALTTVKTCLAEQGCTRLSIKGQMSLSTAFAAGNTLRAPAGFSVEWQQEFNGNTEAWTLSAQGAAQSAAVHLERYGGRLEATDIAVLVSLTRDVRPAFRQSASACPSMRDVLHLHIPGREFDSVLNESDVVGAARGTMRALDRVLNELGVQGTVHFFVSAPAGFCFFLGQLSNTLGRVIVYEHAAGAEIPYVQGVSLNASGSGRGAAGSGV